MSRIFTELYIDEDVSALLTKLLRSRGFVVTSAQEAGMLGCTDEEQLAHATSQRKALLTHNHAVCKPLAAGSELARSEFRETDANRQTFPAPIYSYLA